MSETTCKMRKLLFGPLGWILLSGLVACSRKSDPAVASAGGGVTNPTVVLTMKGAAR
jgi:hypothetical protein